MSNKPTFHLYQGIYTKDQNDPCKFTHLKEIDGVEVVIHKDGKEYKYIEHASKKLKPGERYLFIAQKEVESERNENVTVHESFTPIAIDWELPTPSIQELRSCVEKAKSAFLPSKYDMDSTKNTLEQLTKNLEEKHTKLKDIISTATKKKKEIEPLNNEAQALIDGLENQLNEDTTKVLGELDGQIKERITEYNKKLTEYNTSLSTIQESIEKTSQQAGINITEIGSISSTTQEKIETASTNAKSQLGEIANKTIESLNQSIIEEQEKLSAAGDALNKNWESIREWIPAGRDDFRTGTIPEFNLNSVCESLKQQDLVYSEFQLRNFLALLLTHDLIVLGGLSGSGKTQMVKAMAMALGGESHVIPVKPNWTSGEDLLGFFNPMSHTFAPSPFTEAIVHARNNPSKMHLICLDEMNIARPEYYFADFLSQLEERTDPKITLYARWERDQLIKSELTGDPLQILEKPWEEWNVGEKTAIREYIKALPEKTKRLITDFPPTLPIPQNVRFIGTINVDETTHYLSPKILDRVHVVRFENPLLNKVGQAADIKDNKGITWTNRKAYEPVPATALKKEPFKTLLDWNRITLQPLGIDFSHRLLRQAQLYQTCAQSVGLKKDDVITNSIIVQKILPRLVLDGNVTSNGQKRIDILETLKSPAKPNDWTDDSKGSHRHTHIERILKYAKANHNQINFFA